MNDTVIRSRSQSLPPSLGDKQPDLKQAKVGDLEGRPLIWFGNIPNNRPRLQRPSNGGGNVAPSLLSVGNKISLGEDRPVTLFRRETKSIEGSRLVREHNQMMKAINKDPELKQVQEHIHLVQTAAIEMMGMDPATHEELEYLTSSLTKLRDVLDDQEKVLNSRPLDLNENRVQNPVPVQRAAINYLRNMIEKRLEGVLDLVLPEAKLKPESKLEPKVEQKLERKGEPKIEGTAKELLTKLESRLPKNETIKMAARLIEHGLAQLDRVPGNRLDMGQLAEDLGQILDNLNDLMRGALGKELENPVHSGVSNDIKNLVGAARQQLQMRLTALEKATGLNPLSTNAIFHSKSFSTIGAQNLLGEKLAEAKEKLASLVKQNAPEEVLKMARESVTVLTNGVAYLKDRVEQLRYGNSDERISKGDAILLMGSKGADKGIKSDNEAAKVRNFFYRQVDLTQDGPLPRINKSNNNMREDGVMELFVEWALQQAYMEVPKDLRTELQEHRFAALNSSEWKPISKEVVLRHNGESHAMKSDLVPQSQLGEHFSDMKGGGVVCHASRHFEHGTTVAVSRLTAPDGTTLFEGVRHGILNTYGISSHTLHKLEPGELERLVENLLPKSQWKKNINGDPSLDLTVDRIVNSKTYRRECTRTMQANGSERRALDLVATNLLKNQEKLDFALGEIGKQNPRPVEINLNSIALVTPDHVRGIKGRSGPGNERKMLQGQLKALQKISGDPQPREIVIKNAKGEDQKVLVHIKVNAFNFGVNGGAFKFFGKIGLISGWGTSDAQNRKGMESLIGSKSSRKDGAIAGEVGQWLDKNADSLPEGRREIILKLAGQVAKMWDDKSYHTDGNEPYKMVSRLALLTSMIGGDTCWNCKSGKDRTGQMDVETKRLAAEIWMSGDVPEPDVKPDEVTKANRFRMAMDGGNLEIQNYNTGAPGFKLGGVPSLKDQMMMHKMDDPRYEYFNGIAGFYGT